MRDESGFTLLELIVAAAMIGLLAILMSQFYANQLISYNRNFIQTSLQSNTNQAVQTVIKDIKNAQSVETSNKWPDANSPGGSGNQYSWSSSGSVLVLSVPVQDSSGNLIYVDPLHNALQTNDVVYYVNSASKILYRRVIANPVAGNTAVTTCPPPGSQTCPQDGKVVEDVAVLTAVYYDNNKVVLTGSGIGNATSVQITLQQSRAKFGRTYTSSLTSQGTMRNK